MHLHLPPHSWSLHKCTHTIKLENTNNFNFPLSDHSFYIFFIGEFYFFGLKGFKQISRFEFILNITSYPTAKHSYSVNRNAWWVSTATQLPHLAMTAKYLSYMMRVFKIGHWTSRWFFFLITHASAQLSICFISIIIIIQIQTRPQSRFVFSICIIQVYLVFVWWAKKSVYIVPSFFT